MAAASQSRGWTGPSRRRVPRFQSQVPIDVTVLRSGIPDTVPGRTLNVCERGIAAIMAGEIAAGESVGIEVKLSQVTEPLCARAMVRYYDKLRCGLEFVAISAAQRAAIRDWAKDARAETDSIALSTSMLGLAEEKEAEHREEKKTSSGGGPPGGGRGKKKRRLPWLIAGVVILIAAGVYWWKWNRSWQELESSLHAADPAAAADRAPVQVPAEVMQKLLVHRVEPVYPTEARQKKLEGVIALDVVVDRDGTVVKMSPLNGPDILAQAAMDALRWWKFDAYRVNGDPVSVETTVAIEFKRYVPPAAPARPAEVNPTQSPQN